MSGSKNGGGIYDSVNLNLYHYAGNNPINYLDPTGMATISSEDGVAMINVAEGDNLWSIVKDQSPHATNKEIQSRVNDIVVLNKLNDPNSIKPGQKLKAPNSVVPDITEDLTNKMKTNADDKNIQNPFYFREKVQAGGDWDFKSQKNTIYGTNPMHYADYLFDGEIVRYDAPGNIHYGFVGAATWFGFKDLLLKEAGAAQIQDNPGQGWTGDDNSDAYYIKKGYQLKCALLSIKNLRQFKVC